MAATLPRLYPPHPSGRDRFSPLPAKYASMGRSPIASVHSTVELIGFEVLFQDFMAAAIILDQTAPEMMNVVGDLGVEEARLLVPYDTGATHDSITIVGGSGHVTRPGVVAGQGGSGGFATGGLIARGGAAETEYFVEVGPETFYAPFLEYGTVFMEPRPFMIPALDIMELALVGSVKAIIDAVLGGQGAGLAGSAGAQRVLTDPGVRNPFSQLRSFLYSGAKALGDISVLGGRGLFGPLRASMYGLARTLGDVGSIMNQTLSSRITNRLRGRVTGRIIGFGSASLSFGRTYSAFPGGPTGHRIYQRFLGSHTSLAGVSAYGSSSLVSHFFPGS